MINTRGIPPTNTSTTPDEGVLKYSNTAVDTTFNQTSRPTRANPSVVGVAAHLVGNVRPIIKWPNKILATPCTDVTVFDDELGQLIMDMQWTMVNHDGVGLAAPQIGVSKNVVVIDTSESLVRLPNPLVMINPKIINRGRGLYKMKEGCLSVPGYFEDRVRLVAVVIEYHDPKGTKREIELEGMMSFIAQHELDHLRGKTFVDELSSLKKTFVQKKITKTLRG